MAKYYLALNDHFECWFMYINSDLWNGLSDADKKVLEDEARKLEEERWKIASQEERDNFKLLADVGVQIIEFTDDELTALRDKHIKEVWPKIYDQTREADVKEVIESLK
jgi:TRAP-type C4-dicarboxylate transport system substrate-binding protein